MIAFDIADHRFQLRAAAIVMHEGYVLLHRLEGDAYWSLPGGRVEPGEAAQRTIEREMREELDERVECRALRYVVEAFFELGGRAHHEIGLYFQAELAPGSPLLDKGRTHIGTEGHRRLEFRWFALDELQGLDLRPSFLRESLPGPTDEVRHVVQRG